MKNRVVNLAKEHAIWAVFVLLFIVFSIASPNFLRVNNIFTLVRQVSMYGIAAIGMTFVILIAGIDLSAGSVITIVNIVCAYLMVKMGLNMYVAALLSLVMATLIGVLNGFMVSTIGIPALIATFASQTIFEGSAYLISGGVPITGFDPSFKVLGQGYLFGVVPIPVIVMALCFAVGIFILRKTYFGRYFYAVGGNEEAAKLSGIRVGRIKYLIYALSGFFAGLAGLVLLARTGSAQATAGSGYEFDVITCVVLGGVSVSGGYGKLINVLAGVLIIGVLKNGLIQLNVSSYAQMVVQGIILASAVGFDRLQKKSQLS